MTGPRSSLCSPHQTPTRWSRGLRGPPWTCTATTQTEITSLSRGSRPTRPPRGPSSAISWIGEWPLPPCRHGGVPETRVVTGNPFGCVSGLMRAPPFSVPPQDGLTWVVTGQDSPVGRASRCCTAGPGWGVRALLPGRVTSLSARGLALQGSAWRDGPGHQQSQAAPSLPPEDLRNAAEDTGSFAPSAGIFLCVNDVNTGPEETQ